MPQMQEYGFARDAYRERITRSRLSNLQWSAGFIALLSRLAERHARDPVELVSDHSVVEEVQDTNAAITCPKCARLMTKYKMSGFVANRLDVCPGCDEAWLDGGEWELLKALELSRKMPLVFTNGNAIFATIAEDTRRGIKKSDHDESLDKAEELKPG